jgi:hypothetical protein
MKSMERVMGAIQMQRDLERQILKVQRSHGAEGIRFRNGAFLRFKTRAEGSGRGLSGTPVMMDEAYKLKDTFIGDMAPTVSAQPNPQIWYMSSAVDESKHADGHVLARLRRRALRGGDPSLLYMEWSATPGPDDDNPLKDMPFPLEDIRNTRQANPSLFSAAPGILQERFTANEVRTLGRREYAVERLGIGFWPKDPEQFEDEPEIIPESVVRTHIVTPAVATLRMPPKAMCCLAVDMSADRRWVSISAATALVGGGIHVEIGRHEAPSRELTRALIRWIFRWNPCALVIDRASGATAMLPDLKQAGIEPELTTAGELVAATGAWYDDAMYAGPETLSYADDPLLMAAMAGAKKRELSNGWALARNGTADISSWVSAILARDGLIRFGEKPKTPGAPFVPGGGATTSQYVPGEALTSAFIGTGVDVLNDAF